MPRHPDPELEERILKAADALWKRGGTKALTMRAVARAAGTNTPAVYRRFKNREDLVKGILLRVADRIRRNFDQAKTLQDIAEMYLDFAVENPNEYQLFFTEARLLNHPKKRGVAPRPIRESRPNFAYVEQQVAKELGGKPEDYTQLTLKLWCIAHGAALLLLANGIPEGHEGELRKACLAGVKTLIDNER